MRRISVIGRKNNANTEISQYNGVFAHNAKSHTFTETSNLNVDFATTQRVILLYSDQGGDCTIDGIVPDENIATGQELILINNGVDNIVFTPYGSSVAAGPNKIAIEATLVSGAMLRLMHFGDRWWVHS